MITPLALITILLLVTLIVGIVLIFALPDDPGGGFFGPTPKLTGPAVVALALLGLVGVLLFYLGGIFF